MSARSFAPPAVGVAASATELRPADHGLIAWNYPPYAAVSTALAPVAGTVYVMKIPIPKARLITNVILGLNGPGSGLTAGQNFAALHSSAKTLLSATADQTTAWGAAASGPLIMPLSVAQAVAAGYVYVTFLSNGTTPPPLNRAAGNINNVGLTNATAAFATAGTAQTSMPATITTTAYTTASIWAAVS